jgi:hypothetical protein
MVQDKFPQGLKPITFDNPSARLKPRPFKTLFFQFEFALAQRPTAGVACLSKKAVSI